MAGVMAAACAARGPVRQLELSPTPQNSAEARSSLGEGGAPAPETALQPPAEPIAKPAVKPVPFSVRIRPPSSTVQMVEAADPDLAAALLKLSLSPTAENHRRVAEEYVRLGILDKAHEFLTDALAIDPNDAASWDGRARIWRDWGWPNLALPDATRAVHFAPSSSAARNTLGTVLQTLGRHREAREQYEKALQLNAKAPEVLNNLCFSLQVQDPGSDGVQACYRAYVAGGDLDGIDQTFAAVGQRGRAQYNVGIFHLARRQYASAVKAFEVAHELRIGR
jgi:tetratricopeptide (TPR) repeat protein